MAGRSLTFTCAPSAISTLCRGGTTPANCAGTLFAPKKKLRLCYSLLVSIQQSGKTNVDHSEEFPRAICQNRPPFKRNIIDIVWNHINDLGKENQDQEKKNRKSKNLTRTKEELEYYSGLRKGVYTYGAAGRYETAR